MASRGLVTNIFQIDKIVPSTTNSQRATGPNRRATDDQALAQLPWQRAGIGTQQKTRDRFGISPRLVLQKEAALYCRMGVGTFVANCPVRPIRVATGNRGLRYDLYDLDSWIESLKGNSGSPEQKVDWLNRVGNDATSH
jgi:hypothetical protein